MCLMIEKEKKMDLGTSSSQDKKLEFFLYNIEKLTNTEC